MGERGKIFDLATQKETLLMTHTSSAQEGFIQAERCPAHTADAQVVKAGEDPVTALVTAPLGSQSTAQCDSSCWLRLSW